MSYFCIVFFPTSGSVLFSANQAKSFTGLVYKEPKVTFSQAKFSGECYQLKRSSSRFLLREFYFQCLILWLLMILGEDQQSEKGKNVDRRAIKDKSDS